MTEQKVTIRLGLGLDAQALSILHSITGAVEQAQAKVAENAERLRRKEKAAADKAKAERSKAFAERINEKAALIQREVKLEEKAAKQRKADDKAEELRLKKAKEERSKAFAERINEKADVIQREVKLDDQAAKKKKADDKAEELRLKKAKEERSKAFAERINEKADVIQREVKLDDQAAKKKKADDKAEELRLKKAKEERSKAFAARINEQADVIQRDFTLKAKAASQQKADDKAEEQRLRNQEKARERAEKKRQSEAKRSEGREAASWKATKQSAWRVTGGVAGAVANSAGAAFATGRELLEGMGYDFTLGGAMQRSERGLRMATSLSNQAIVAGDPRNAMRQNPEALLAETRDLGQRFGFTTEEGLAALTRFTEKTGDLAAARPILGDLAALAGATGSSLEHVADAAAEASLQLGDMEHKSEGIVDVLRQAAGQAKIGTVEFKNFASHYGKIVATSRFFTNERDAQLTPAQALKGNQATLVALAQMAKSGGSGSVREQIIGVSTFMTQFQKGKRRAEMKAILGEDIDTKDGKLRDPFELLKLMMRKTGGKLELLHPMIQDAQAKRVTIAMAQRYTEARTELTKQHPTWTKAQLDNGAIEELERQFNKLREATLSQLEVERALEAVRSRGLTGANAFNIEMEKLADEFRTGMLPLMPDLIAGVRGLTSAAENFLDVLDPTRKERHQTQQALEATGDVQDVAGNIRLALEKGTRETPVELPKGSKEALEARKLEAEKALALAQAEEAAVNKPKGPVAGVLGLAEAAMDWVVNDVTASRSNKYLKGNYAKPADDIRGTVAHANVSMRQVDVEMLTTALNNLNDGLRRHTLKVTVDGGPPAAGALGNPAGARSNGEAEVR